MERDEKVIDKIRKLLALSGNNPNEHEREQAMQRALEMLAKHNLTMSDVGPIGRDKPQLHLTDIHSDRWRMILCSAVAELYYCRVLLRNGRILFLGTPQNAAAAQEISSWLISIISAEVRKQVTPDETRRRAEQQKLARAADTRTGDYWEFWRLLQGAPDTKQLRTSFKLGAAMRIQSRVVEMRKHEKETNGESSYNTLVLMRNQLEQDLADVLQSMKLRNSRARHTSVDSSAYDMGEKYADTIGLERQISTSSSKRIAMR